MSHIDASLLRVSIDATKLNDRLIYDTTSSLYENLKGNYAQTAFASHDRSDDLLESFRLAAIIAHEQRHYVDYLLTNYGSWVFRFWPQIKQSIDALMMYEGRVIVPLRYWADEVWQRHLNAPLPESLRAMARMAGNHSAVLTRDRIPNIPAAGPMSGSYQLEALATAFEVGPIEMHLEPRYWGTVADAIGRDIHHWNKRYTWPTAVLSSFEIGSTPTEYLEGGITNTRLWPIILTASLMGRFTDLKFKNVNAKPEMYYDILPSWRFVRITTWLTEHYASKLTEPSETWDAVNEACCDLFGATVVEDLNAELDVIDEIVSTALSKQRERYVTFPIIDILAHVKERRRLAKGFAADPLRFLDPRRYWAEGVPSTESLIPGFMLVNKSGFDAIPVGMEPMKAFNAEAREVGSPFFIKPTPPPSMRNYEEVDELLTLLSRYYVAGKAVTSWVGPELDVVLKIIGDRPIAAVPPYN